MNLTAVSGLESLSCVESWNCHDVIYNKVQFRYIPSLWLGGKENEN